MQHTERIRISGICLLAACICIGESGAVGQTRTTEFPELQEPHFRISELVGLGEEDGICRRDPSDVIRVADTYYVWYTKVDRGPDVFQYPSGYSGEIWYATSPDGAHWREQGKALGTGDEAAFDSGGVFTPNILEARGSFYLFYTAVRSPVAADHPTVIGLAISHSPRGPWRKASVKPVLMPSEDTSQFDSFRIDDACLILREGKYWLYYKGRQVGHTPGETKWGVAIAEKPEGPYRKSSMNPVVGSGHEVLVWPDRHGVAALVGPTGPEKNTIQYAEDGLHFHVISHLTAPPMAPGAYRPDAFSGARNGHGIRWGIAMKNGQNPYLVRFEYETSGSIKAQMTAH
jgi:hypothetical protein